MARRRKQNSKSPMITLVVLILISVMAFAIVNMIDEDEYLIANVLEVSGNYVTIGHNCSAIIAETSSERAYSILLGAQGVIEKRPTTHDIFVETLKNFNITIDKVLIEDFDNEFYYSFIIFNSGEKILKLDAKPSDAIAMAVRTGSEIYIKKDLLDEIGVDVCNSG